MQINIDKNYEIILKDINHEFRELKIIDAIVEGKDLIITFTDTIKDIRDCMVDMNHGSMNATIDSGEVAITIAVRGDVVNDVIKRDTEGYDLVADNDYEIGLATVVTPLKWHLADSDYEDKMSEDEKSQITVDLFSTYISYYDSPAGSIKLRLYLIAETKDGL